MNWKSGVDYRFIAESDTVNHSEYYQVHFYDRHFANFPKDELPKPLRTIFFVVSRNVQPQHIESLIDQFLSIELAGIAPFVKARTTTFCEGGFK